MEQSHEGDQGNRYTIPSLFHPETLPLPRHYRPVEADDFPSKVSDFVPRKLDACLGKCSRFIQDSGPAHIKFTALPETQAELNFEATPPYEVTIALPLRHGRATTG